MRGLGAFVILLGVGAVVLGALFDPSVSSGGIGRVINIGLSADRQMIIIGGFATVICGVVLLVGGEIVETMERLAGKLTATVEAPGGPDPTASGEGPRVVHARLGAGRVIHQDFVAATVLFDSGEQQVVPRSSIRLEGVA